MSETSSLISYLTSNTEERPRGLDPDGVVAPSDGSVISSISFHSASPSRYTSSEPLSPSPSETTTAADSAAAVIAASPNSNANSQAAVVASRRPRMSSRHGDAPPSPRGAAAAEDPEAILQQLRKSEASLLMSAPPPPPITNTNIQQQKKKQEAADRALALSLQNKLRAAPPPKPMSPSRRQRSDPAANTTGRALTFVQAIVEGHESWVAEQQQGGSESCMNSSRCVALCHADDMVHFAEQTLKLQEQFKIADKSTSVVDLAFCFAPMDGDTTPNHDTSQQQRMQAAKLRTNGTWLWLGDGIYTANSPFLHSEKLNFQGPTRLLVVARLRGKMVHRGAADGGDPQNDADADTVVGNVGAEEISVLRQNAQCVPLLRIYPRFFMDHKSQGDSLLSDYMSHLTQIVDEHFNTNRAAAAARARSPGAVRTPFAAAPPMVEKDPKMKTIVYYTAPPGPASDDAPPVVLVVDANVDLKNHRPLHPRHGAPTFENFCKITKDVVRIVPSKPDGRVNAPRFSMAYPCGSTFNVGMESDGNNNSAQAASSSTWPALFDDHNFLRRLHERIHEHSKRCTAGCCRGSSPAIRDYRTSRGSSPSGSMRVDELPELTCPGHEAAAGTLMISYRIAGGVQTEDQLHPNPGQPFRPIYREAFLPAHAEGRDLLKRFQFAFSRGLTFTVGTSLTTGVHGTVKWASIPHKSTLSHHLFGYPDPHYFQAANNELDDLGVPIASDL